MDFLKKNSRTILIGIAVVLFVIFAGWAAIELFSYYIWLQKQGFAPLTVTTLA
ncbi:MAG: hypothetical protein QY314_03270 [Candidatus Dojkabacteria bacterium]|nr:MAG: hypothetical protein QY314_03270 [Candidatus Dojkabacteria bacterium]